MTGTVVITGASSGIGRATALHLDSLGYDVYAGVRKPADADAIAAAGSPRLRPLTIDVADLDSIDQAAERVTEELGERGLAGLFNNAGISIAGPLELLPLEEFRRSLDVNLVGQLAVTQAFLPLIRRTRGRLIYTSTVSGRVSVPFLGAYVASKQGLEGMADCLRRELRPFGIKVSIVEPGAIATDIWSRGTQQANELREQLGPDAERLYGTQMDALTKEAARSERMAIPPHAVAKVVEHALTAKRPRLRYVVGRDAQVMIRATSILPDRLVDRIVAWQLGR